MLMIVLMLTLTPMLILMLILTVGKLQACSHLPYFYIHSYSL
jgi:hypothetical protein